MNQRAEEIQQLMEAAEAAVTGEAVIPDPEPHSILEIWSSILSNIEAEEEIPVSVKQAAKITAMWPKLEVQDCSAYQALYYEYLKEMRAVLEHEISTDPDCFSRVGEEDGELNWHHYMNVNLTWVSLTRQWEKSWNSDDWNSHISMAALADAGSFCVSSEGIISMLQHNHFQLDPVDMEWMQEILIEGEK